MYRNTTSQLDSNKRIKVQKLVVYHVRVMSDVELDIMDVEENKPVVVELKEEKKSTSGQWSEVITTKTPTSPPRKVQRTDASGT